jgi:predicted AAA+ superfamily ATPase
MIPRTRLLNHIKRALRRSPSVSLLGPKQSGKTTLARTLLAPESENYFDLERPTGLRRLEDPETSLGELRGLVVIDEVQRRPELFPILRVLIDRPRSPARFLLLGSASPALLRQSSESRGGRTGSLRSPMVARRISAVICCNLGFTQLHVARGVHTHLSRTGLAAARYADS